MKKNSMNCKRSKHSIMLIMLGIALSVILLLASSLGFASDIHRWDFYKYYYDEGKVTYLYDPVGHWWDKDQTKTFNPDYVSFIEQIIPEIPKVTLLPWLSLRRVANDSPGDTGGHAKIYTYNTSTGVYDNPVAGKFRYSAYFNLNSLPSSSSCQTNPTLPNQCAQDACRTEGCPDGLTCCGQVLRNCADHSCNAWYVVIEMGGVTSIGAPIYVAYDDTVRGFFTNLLTTDRYGSENPDEVIAEDITTGEPFHVETGRWYKAQFTVERLPDTNGNGYVGAQEELKVLAYYSMCGGGRWVKVAEKERIIQPETDDPAAQVGVPVEPPVEPPDFFKAWHFTIGSNAGGNTFYFDGLIDRVEIVTNLPTGMM